VATDRVYEAFYDANDYSKTLFHGHTYGGNPIACAAALASLDIFEREPVLERVDQRAATLDKMLTAIVADHPLVVDVRRQGLMVGIEIVSGGASNAELTPSGEAAWKACLKARELGVFVRPLGDTIVVMPPLSIEESEIKQICEAVRYGIESVAGSAAGVG
jgi:adenosylmethionine-8-amino-7-oxononanoate aminotransferase